MSFPWNPFNIPTPKNQTPWDLTFFGIGSVIGLGTLFFGIILMMGFRKSAIKSKQPFLSFLGIIFSIMWFLGAASTNGFFNQTRWMCLVFNFILYYIGMVGWCLCLFVRLLTLFLVYRLKFHKKYLPPSLFLVGLFMIPCVIILILVSIWTDQFIKHNPDELDCKNTWVGATTGAFMALPPIFGILLFTCLNLRVRKEFNETKVETIGVALMLIEFVLVFFCWSMRFNRLPPIKIMTAFQGLVLEVYYFWALNGFVLWKFITCQSKYFRTWEAKYAEHTMLMMEEQKIQDQLSTKKQDPIRDSKSFFDNLTTLNQNDDSYHRLSDSISLTFSDESPELGHAFEHEDENDL